MAVALRLRSVVGPLLSLALTVLLRLLLPLRESSPLPPEVVIQSASSGRYVTVAPDGWLAATTFSPTEPTSRFVVRSVGPALLAALTEARSFSPTSRANAEDELWSGGGAGDAPTEASPRSAAPCRWVLLQSRAAGGFVSVRGQHESDEYVVQLAREGSLSYRSLLLLTSAGVWSYAVGGYLNFRVDGATQPWRAHGNDEPRRQLLSLPLSARAFVRRPPPTPSTSELLHAAPRRPAPEFDWGLLLDAARAGACGTTSAVTLRRAAAAAAALRERLGEYGDEAPALVAAYRRALRSPSSGVWSSVEDALSPRGRARHH